MYPGIDPDANEGSYINALSISFVALSFVTVCLRLFSRWWTKIEFGTDDWLILVAAVRIYSQINSLSQYPQMLIAGKQGVFLGLLSDTYCRG